jgi:hypothetical protein
MQRFLQILFLLIILFSCSSKPTQEGCLWRIQTCNNSNYLFRAGTEVYIKHHSVLITNTDKKEEYKAIITSNRIVIENGYSNYLFEIELMTDSILTLHELYSKKPIEITLIKNSN